MATRKAPPEVVEDPTAVDDLGPSGVRSLEPEPDPGLDYQGVDEVPPEQRSDLTQTSNIYTTPGVVNEVVEYEPEIVEAAEPTYRIRLTQDIAPIFIGIDFPIPAMSKDVLYEVNQRVYDYLLPKGLIQGSDMATSKATTESAEEPVEEPTAEPQAQPPKGEEGGGEVPEVQAYELPPTLLEAGLSGVVGTVSGQFTLASGSSFWVSPGQAYAVNPEDAAELVERGAAVELADFSKPA